MPSTAEILKTIGEPIVNEAFEELLSSRIPSTRAKMILNRFSKRWKDYSRPALMVLACRAVGGDETLVHAAAKALILSGGAFDLHDDIIDKSYVRTRKKKKSIMGLYGADATLLTGDALLIGGLMQLTKMCRTLPAETYKLVIQSIQDGLFELGGAEMDELRLVRNLNATPRAYLRIVKMKAADVESYLRIGSIIGNGTKEENEALGRFGRLLGMVCILQDDVGDTFNDKLELTSRICNESLPLPLLYALEDAKCRAKVKSIMNSPSNKELDQLISLIDKNQGFERTKKIIQRYSNEAKAELKYIRNPGDLRLIFNI